MAGLQTIRNAADGLPKIDSPYIEEVKIDEIQMDTGKVKIRMELAETFYYELLSELTGTKIGGEYELIGTMKKTCPNERRV